MPTASTTAAAARPHQVTTTAQGPGGESNAERFLRELYAKAPSTLSFADYAAEALDHNAEYQDGRTKDEPWQSYVFYLIRLLKAHPEMAGATRQDALDDLAYIIEDRYPDSDDPWWEYTGEMSAEDVEAEFIAAWDAVRRPAGLDPLDNARLLADQCRLKLRPLGRDRTSGYPRFVTLAAWLQTVRGDENILLPVEAVAPMLKVTPMTISRYREWARKDGYLIKVKDHRAPRAGQRFHRGDATEFRFDLSRFPKLQEMARTQAIELVEGDVIYEAGAYDPADEVPY